MLRARRLSKKLWTSYAAPEGRYMVHIWRLSRYKECIRGSKCWGYKLIQRSRVGEYIFFLLFLSRNQFKWRNFVCVCITCIYRLMMGNEWGILVIMYRIWCALSRESSWSIRVQIANDDRGKCETRPDPFQDSSQQETMAINWRKPILGQNSILLCIGKYWNWLWFGWNSLNKNATSLRAVDALSK